MNTLERSLCRTCSFVDSCSLTSNKSFIWSCSEYELAKETEETNDPQTLTKKFKQNKKERLVELI
ncbi:hypothetical protein [Xanthomarina sp. GH4-25]|uniref:hypothetical protein n=1 Tax=Xanthomarina sp. GH4-25 TaxID=3349335 RepID=UPI0038783A9F